MASKAISVGVGIPMIVAGATNNAKFCAMVDFNKDDDQAIMEQSKRTAVQTRIIL